VGNKKYSRNEDIVRRVLAVIALVSSNIPLSVFQNDHMKIYLNSLDPKHQLPHHLEINRILEVMADYAMKELAAIIAEQREVLREGFISLSTDFVSDPVRKEAFGVIMLDLVAKKYRLNDGRTLFMSNATKIRNQKILASVSLSLCHVKLYYSCLLELHK
jgi:hypothetical protein